jgi:hypothetical protein
MQNPPINASIATAGTSSVEHMKRGEEGRGMYVPFPRALCMEEGSSVVMASEWSQKKEK